MRTYWNSTIRRKSRVETKERRKKHEIKRAILGLDPPRNKIIKELDKVFSDFLKKEAGGVCARCHGVKKRSGVSHYYGRSYYATRWSVENCVWVCWGCHSMQMEKFKAPGEWYHRFMLKRLGKEGFERLERLAHSETHFSTADLKTLLIYFKSNLK